MLSRNDVNRILDTFGLEARKAFGQNFVVDPSVVMRIAELSGVGPGDAVVEIGPGLGSLTLALHDTGANVLAVEKDSALVPVLREVLGSRGADDVSVVEADALEVDWSRLLGAQSRWSLVANLPYNVAVPIVLGVLERAPMIERLLIMVQLEVAERLAAQPRGRTIGVPSIHLGWYGTARIVGTVDPDAFVPRPNVTSALLEIERQDPMSSTVTCAEMMSLVATAYRHRRKMLRSTLGRTVTSAQFELAAIEPTSRPEELSVAQWVRLTEVVQHP